MKTWIGDIALAASFPILWLRLYLFGPRGAPFFVYFPFLLINLIGVCCRCLRRDANLAFDNIRRAIRAPWQFQPRFVQLLHEGVDAWG